MSLKSRVWKHREHVLFYDEFVCNLLPFCWHVGHFALICLHKRERGTDLLDMYSSNTQLNV